MALLALSFLLILIFLYDRKIFIYSLVIFYALFDMFDGFYEEEKIFMAMRYLAPLILVVISIARESAFKKTDFIFFMLCIYLLILLVFSDGNIIITARNLMSLLLTLLMIPLGRAIGRRANFLVEFENFNRFLLIALPVYIIVANIFHFGESYTEAFTTGFLITSRMYLFPIVVFLAIHYVISNKEKSSSSKAVDVVFILINIGIIIINTRRTALGMLAAALLVYGLLNRKLIFKMVMLGVFLIVTLVVAFPLYENMLTAQLEKRERIQNLDTYEEEGRVLETIYLFDYHSRRQHITEILFGVNLFDTYDFGTVYFGRDRPIHSDVNMIFFSTGLTGIILFGIFFFHYFFIGNRRIAFQNRKVYYPVLVMFLIVLLPGRFIGTLTYAPLLMLILSAVKAWRPEIAIQRNVEAFAEQNEFAIN